MADEKQASSMAVGGGLITIADREFYVRALGIRQEHALGVELRRRVKQSYGSGGYFQKCQAQLEYLKAAKLLAEFTAAVTRLTEMEANGELPSGDAVDQFRMTPDGVAIEVFYRTRDTHPEVTQKEFISIITETNAIEVHIQILKVLSDEGKA